MNQTRPQRRANRLKNFDYGSTNCYFVTFCVKDGASLLWRWRGEEWEHELSDFGLAVERAVLSVDGVKNIHLHHYAIMPNHVHMIIELLRTDNGEREQLSDVVRYVKSQISREIGNSIWQRSYYDHVIRDEKDYQRVWEYVENNPAKWKEDRYYSPNT